MTNEQMANGPSPIFGFETDFAGTLRCIPMIVRFKLDQCGVKLSLKQWSRFGRDERDLLVTRTCNTPDEVKMYRQYLIELIESRAKGKAEDVAIDLHPEWRDVERVPERLRSYALNLGVSPPSIEKWATLSPLKRFALFKLTRPGHDNDNFIPAMREFELTN